MRSPEHEGKTPPSPAHARCTGPGSQDPSGQPSPPVQKLGHHHHSAPLCRGVVACPLQTGERRTMELRSPGAQPQAREVGGAPGQGWQGQVQHSGLRISQDPTGVGRVASAKTQRWRWCSGSSLGRWWRGEGDVWEESQSGSWGRVEPGVPLARSPARTGRPPSRSLAGPAPARKPVAHPWWGPGKWFQGQGSKICWRPQWLVGVAFVMRGEQRSGLG